MRKIRKWNWTLIKECFKRSRKKGAKRIRMDRKRNKGQDVSSKKKFKLGYCALGDGSLKDT